jgi:UDP-MurNAc hydroxylase
MYSSEISFINHASFAFKTLDLKILSDPWYWGSAFDDGWNLIYENPIEEIEKLLEETTYIFLSHEHPDHMSIPFFKRFKKTLQSNNIKIIFQTTKDNRVFNFLKKQNLSVQLMHHARWVNIGSNTRLMVYKSGLIDSALVIESLDSLFINLNDCDFSQLELIRLNKLLPNHKKRIISNQFSYAAYRSNDKWLEEAAKSKLNSLISTFKALKGNLLIPFASFAYFSHFQNSHLNSYYNSPEQTSAFLRSNNIKHAFMKASIREIQIKDLLDTQISDQINSDGINFWSEKLGKKRIILQQISNKSIRINEHTRDEFLERIQKNNNILLMLLIKKISFNLIFGVTSIKLIDSDDYYEVSFNKIKKLSNIPSECHLEMTHESFIYMLTQPHGIDTLSVNGRFSELSKNGFKKFIFSLGFHTLNSAGYGVKFRDLFSIRILTRLVSIPMRILLKNS